jgi:SMC interacting uncharacterized protein involved in chromosome segregation
MIVPILEIPIPDALIGAGIGAGLTGAWNIANTYLRGHTQQRLNAAQQIAIDQRHMIDTLQRQVHELSINVAHLSGEVKSAQSEITTWRERSFQLIEERGLLRAELSAAEEKIKRLEIDVAKLRTNEDEVIKMRIELEGLRQLDRRISRRRLDDKLSAVLAPLESDIVDEGTST